MPYLESILLGVSLAAIPGPVFFEVMRRTLARGFGKTSLLILGVFLADFLLLVLTFYGLSQFLAIGWLSVAMYLAGGLLLIFIGVSSMRISEKEIKQASKKKASETNSAFMGFGLAFTSPLSIAVWISLGGSYLAQYAVRSVALTHMLMLAFGVMVFFFGLAFAVHTFRGKIESKYILATSKLFGLVLICYGVYALSGLANFA